MAKGIPKYGSQSARQIKGWPTYHADDIEDGTHEYHTPLSVYAQAAAPGVGDDSGDGYEPGSRWVDTTNDKYYVCLDATLGAAVWLEVGAPAALADHDHSGDAGDGGVFDAANLGSGASGDGTVLTSDGAGGSAWEAVPGSHDAVTLDSDAAVLLDLTGQEIGLDTQDANKVFAGPTTGAANEPTFRAIVAADLGSGTPDGTKFLRDDLSWQVGSATDANAIHDNVAGEINAITEKASPVDADLVIIEDSEDSNNKKKVQVGNLPGGAPGGATDVLMVQVFS